MWSSCCSLWKLNMSSGEWTNYTVWEQIAFVMLREVKCCMDLMWNGLLHTWSRLPVLWKNKQTKKKPHILFLSLIKGKSSENIFTLSCFHPGENQIMDIGIKRIIVACLWKCLIFRPFHSESIRVEDWLLTSFGSFYHTDWKFHQCLNNGKGTVCKETNS